MKILIDIYGADAGIRPIVLGVAKAIRQALDFFPILVGDGDAIVSIMRQQNIADDAYEIIHTDRFIGHDEPANCIFGGRDDSSMAMAYARLKQDDTCRAMLSPGSTGALLVGSICRLGLMPGLKYPALASALPCAGKELVCLVDCGANVACTAADLARFALMGSVFSKSCCGIERPRVGLMSVGREKQKGSSLTLEAYEKISQLPVNFVGNLEGSDLVSGYADVVVSDGFAGNILLKSTEAAGKAALQTVEQVAADADPALLDKIRKALFTRFDFNAQGAATFLGPKKTVVKMHGCANEDTVVASLEQILRLERAGFCNAMMQALQQ